MHYRRRLISGDSSLSPRRGHGPCVRPQVARHLRTLISHPPRRQLAKQPAHAAAPRPMTWCSNPGASSLGCLGMARSDHNHVATVNAMQNQCPVSPYSTAIPLHGATARRRDLADEPHPAGPRGPGGGHHSGHECILAGSVHAGGCQLKRGSEAGRLYRMR